AHAAVAQPGQHRELGVVGAAVVDDDDLPVVAVLRELLAQLGQQRGKRLALVVGGQDAADRQLARARRCRQLGYERLVFHGCLPSAFEAMGEHARGASRQSDAPCEVATRAAFAIAATAASSWRLTSTQSGALPQRSAKPCCASTSREDARVGSNRPASLSSRRQLSRFGIAGSCQSEITGTGALRCACSGTSKKYSSTKTIGSPGARRARSVWASSVLSRV